MQLTDTVIEVKDITVYYDGKIKALDGISFSVEKGDFVGMIGPNGAGKTTLFKCMLGIMTRYRGTIVFFGQDIKKSKSYLKKVGYVPQKTNFEGNFPITVKEVVGMGLANAKGVDDPNETVEKALQTVWLHELAHKRLGDLSGGQQQRVFIAKALVSDPQILILDEPVTGVDSHSKQTFYHILQHLNDKEGITILWSSHDLDAVSGLAKKVACINRSLFFHGDSEKFFHDDSLLKLYSESSMQMHMKEQHQ